MRPDWEKFKESSPINYSEIPVEQMSEYHPVKQEENIRGYENREDIEKVMENVFQ